MSETTEIAWTDHTWSPWEGCQKVGPGCDNCYAEARNQRFARGANWGPGAPRRRTADWTKPILWDRKAAKEGRRARIFPSLCDPFDNAVDPTWRADLFSLIYVTPHLDWLLLTKRIGNVEAMVGEVGGWPANAQLGITVVNQPEADRDVHRAIAATRSLGIDTLFLSVEPMLGPVDLTGEYLAHRCGGTYPFKGLEREHRTRLIDLVNWVIVGGESGPKARPMNLRWARDLRDQCAAAGVPYLFKQHGEWLGVGNDPNEVQRLACIYGPTVHCYSWPNGDTAIRIGKKTAGRLLDGREHNEFPRPA
jgi:protein gp37